MALMSGKSGTLTPRDQDILETIFLCRYLSTKEIATLFFTSFSRARARLPELAKKGYIKGRTMYVRDPTWEDRAARETVWHLEKAGFTSVSESLGFEEAYVSKPLLPKQARHYVRAAEVYVAARDGLDDELGSYPQWEWHHEKRAFYAGEYEDELYEHNPDAHILFRDHVYIIERQTAESKVGPKAIYEKVRGHKLYAEVRLRKPAEVLFACDDPNVAHQAERAGEQYGIRVVGGDVQAIADYLYSSAVRLS